MKYTLRIVESPRGQVFHIRDDQQEIVYFGVDKGAAEYLIEELNKPSLIEVVVTKSDISKMATKYMLGKMGINFK